MNLSFLSSDKELCKEMLDRATRRGLQCDGAQISTHYLKNLAAINGDMEAPRGLSPTEEAIIRVFGRPSLLIRKGTFEVPLSDVWAARLNTARPHIERAFRAVGRIEVENHQQLDWLGTGWLLTKDLVVTNRHVAEEFAVSSGVGFRFRQNRQNKSMKARLDVREEYMEGSEIQLSIAEVVHIEPEPGPDVAVLRLSEAARDPGGEIEPLGLDMSLQVDLDVAVVGYPAFDSRTKDIAAMRHIFGEIFDVKRLAPGKVSSLPRDPAKDSLTHDCSTLGGCSGAPILNLNTGRVVGLHFAGSEKVANYAVPADALARLFKERKLI